MRRSLSHYRALHAAVAAGAAVSTAVLGGALLVGDSLRGSLEQLTLERLGGVDAALVSGRLLAPDAAERVSAAPGFGEPWRRLAPALSLDASVVHADRRSVAGRVALWGIDRRFVGLVAGDGADFPLPRGRGDGRIFPESVINRSLADELGAAVGDPLLLSFEAPAAVPRASLLGRSDPDRVLTTLRTEVAALVPDDGVGSFRLQPHQGRVPAAFVDLEALGRALERPGGANALLAAGVGEPPPAGATAALGSALAEGLTLADLGLEVSSGEGWVQMTSRELILPPPAARAALAAAGRVGLPARPVLTYLANELRAGERAVPYSTVSALDLRPPRPGGPEDRRQAGGAGSVPPDAGGGGEPSELITAPGGRPEPPGEGEILLDRWTADQLAVAPGDRVEMAWYAVAADDSLVERRTGLTVAAVVEMAGLATDPHLMPELPGVSEARDMRGWDPPFPVDLDAVRPVDEEYWDRHRAAPKGFVSLATGRSLWASRFGDTTLVRLAAPAGEETAVAERFAAALAAELDPAELGFAFRPVKAEGLEAAAGNTDFAGLFLGFSLFLIVSAALLVALLFALQIELRAREVGLLRALGFPRRAVRRRLLAEGSVVALVGVAAGTLLALGYAAGLLALLGRWWRPLLGGAGLALHVDAVSLAVAATATLLLVLLAMLAALRRLRRVPTPGLLAGATEPPARPGRRRLAPWVAAGGLAVAVALLVVARLAGEGSEAGLFFGVGAALCAAGFAAFALWCGRSRGDLDAGLAASRLRMAARSAARSPGRSLLAVTLVGCASFVLVAVAANRKDPERATRGLHSGAGGFALVAETDVPLYRDPGTPAGRARLGLGPDAEAILAGAGVVPLRLRPGDDASCLNLYQPEEPRLLGVPDALVGRGGFRFRSALRAGDNPWTLLGEDLGPGVVPAIGDHASVRWILHAGLGDEIPYTDDHGEPVRLRIVGLLESSIFQRELLISEGAFLAHFPRHGGYRSFLLDLPAGSSGERAEEAARVLEADLGRWGFDAVPTADRLAAFQSIEGLYLSTFQLLGGLGLLLGTLGLAVVLLRNVVERRRELAVLRAFGYRRSTLAWLVVGENAVLLVAGIAIGSVAGLVAVAPHLLAGGAPVPWGSLGWTLGAVVASGLAASALAVRRALAAELLPALKRE